MSADRRWALVYAAALTVAVGALAGVLARMTLLVPMAWSFSTIEARIAEVLVGVALVGVVFGVIATFTIVPTYGARSDRIESGEVPWLVLLAFGAVICFGVGFGGVQPYAGGFADAHTDTYGGFGGPHADFDVSVEPAGDGRAIVTFTHAGGDPLPADRVTVRGEGFAAVDGVDHQGPGAWQGTVSGERPRRGGAAIVEGDSVTVGVSDECMIGLVTTDGETSSTIVGYSCRDH